jgi:hypothetical protein
VSVGSLEIRLMMPEFVPGIWRGDRCACKPFFAISVILSSRSKYESLIKMIVSDYCGYDSLKDGA